MPKEIYSLPEPVLAKTAGRVLAQGCAPAEELQRELVAPSAESLFETLVANPFVRAHLFATHPELARELATRRSEQIQSNA